MLVASTRATVRRAGPSCRNARATRTSSCSVDERELRGGVACSNISITRQCRYSRDAAHCCAIICNTSRGNSFSSYAGGRDGLLHSRMFNRGLVGGISSTTAGAPWNKQEGGPAGGPPRIHAAVPTAELCWRLCEEGKAEELAVNLVARVLDALRGPRGLLSPRMGGPSPPGEWPQDALPHQRYPHKYEQQQIRCNRYRPADDIFVLQYQAI